MPIVVERKEDDSPKSTLSALAKNSMRSRLKNPEGTSNFLPIDDRFYDALGSLVMWYSVMDAKLSQVAFYISQGYNSNIRIQTSGEKECTLVEFAINVFKRSRDQEFRKEGGKIAKYLSEMVRIRDGINPLFQIDPDPKDKMFKMQSRYSIGTYSCTIAIEGRELLIGESREQSGNKRQGR